MLGAIGECQGCIWGSGRGLGMQGPERAQGAFGAPRGC